MASEQRKLLEQLMGDNFNSVGPAAPKVNITDAKVCKSYVCGECPHDLFSNTKSDLGPCPSIHNEAHKAEYQGASEAQKGEWQFTYELCNDYARFVLECDRRIAQAEQRLEKTPEELRKTTAYLKEINELSESIELHAAEIIALGTQSQVSLAVTEHYKMRMSMQRMMDVERELKSLSDTGGPSGHQKLQVCDTCGAYLSRLDNDRRLADHFAGKMHLGFRHMRVEYEKLKNEWDGKPAPARVTAQQHSRGGGGFGGDGYAGGYGDGHGGRPGGGGRGFGGGRGGRRGGFRGGR